MTNELRNQADYIINELHLYMHDIRHNQFGRADDRVTLIKKYIDQLQRMTYMATRNSGEVK